MQKPLLFSLLTLRGVTAPNRCVVSPMVQFRATDGLVNDFHLVHLGKFALGKFGIVFTDHPDMTRILLPDEWSGHPLRKDYSVGRIPVQFKAARTER